MKNYERFKIGVIVLNYGNPDNTLKLIHSLIKISIIKKIILVDNFSSQNNSILLSKKIKKINSNKIILKLNKKNLGYGRGNNIGLKICFKNLKLNYALLLNPDVKIINFFNGNTLKKNIDFNKKIIFTGKIKEKKKYFSLYHFNEFLMISKNYKKRMSDQNMPIYCSGSCIGFTKAFWKSEGGFSSDYFLYFEELDLIYRFFNKYKKFPKIIALKSLKINHLKNRSMGENDHEISQTVDFWSSRSRLIFVKKFKAFYLLNSLIYNMLKIFQRLIQFKLKNIFLIITASKKGLYCKIKN